MLSSPEASAASDDVCGEPSTKLVMYEGQAGPVDAPSSSKSSNNEKPTHTAGLLCC